MSRYAALHHPAPVWSIFDYAAALFVEPVLEGASLLGSFRTTGRCVAGRRPRLWHGLTPKRPRAFISPVRSLGFRNG